MSGGLGDTILQLLMQAIAREEQNPGMSALQHTGKHGPAMPNATDALWTANSPFGGSELEAFNDPNQSVQNMMARSQRTTDNRDPTSNSFRAPGGRGPTQEAAQRGRMRGR